MTLEITFRRDLSNVDWNELRSTLAEDEFDNGRTSAQLRQSFENSPLTVIATVGDNVIGTARALTDGVCNAYIVDVWTLSKFRRRGVATRMMQMLLDQLSGQHVYLFTDDSVEFYKRLDFQEQPLGLGQVVGTWLNPKA